MSVEEYVYWGGVVQGEGLSEYIRNFRRRMFDTVLGHLLDVQRLLAGHAQLDDRRLLPAPHAGLPPGAARVPAADGRALRCEDGQVQVFGVNEGPAWQGELRYGLFALAGGYPLDRAARG